MKATLSVSAMCVLVSSWIITRGAGAFTTDAAVTQAIRGVLPMTALTLAAHASAVTLEGLLLVRRDMPFLCRAYALLAVLFLGANKLIVTHNLGKSKFKSPSPSLRALGLRRPGRCSA